jgi:undecaprenyl diphosphate synthase
MKVPNCIGFIMDGNRRWAKDQNLPTLFGHKEGAKTFRKTITDAKSFGVKNLIFYAFSTENWKRAKKEVTYLLDLLLEEFGDLKEVHKNKLRVKFIGNRSAFSKRVQALMVDLEEKTKGYTEGLVAIALSYGGRAEIVNATNKIIEEGRTKPITEKDFENYLWTNGIPDPDLIIRTGDTMRLSNFLPWQSVYSELSFTNTYWPDFDKEELEYILQEYMDRERRMGK